MTQSLTKRVSRALTPEWVKIRMKRMKRGLDLTTELGPDFIGPTRGEAAEAFARVRDVRGAFNFDDAGYFLLALRQQSLLGLSGDMLEIGSYHGRSTAIMSLALQDGERLHVCDLFDDPSRDQFAVAPTPEILRRSIARVNPGLGEDRVVIHSCRSDALEFPPEQRFRFIHVDGGHAAETCAGDLALARARIAPGGLIVVDDYANPDWPGVQEATDAFLSAHPDIRIVADVNRHGDIGRKLYLGAPAAPM